MFITEGVDLPEQIIDAHAKGRLVFFVGAGASMDDPSNLPSFTKLARNLADEAKVPFDEDIAIDLFLGSMPSNFDVHAHAHRLTSPNDSAPNPTHRAIVRVASSTGSPRVVTTNFDDHLASAAAFESVSIDDKWIGPALPMGDEFTGVVHLHGSVLRKPSELVLTDHDFGRAYLTDAWATRFLQRMFEKFTVLFVGYSLDDPIMRYLSLGLPSKTRRYVLTHKPADDKWNHLGILPISYPGTDDDHSALLAALQAWDSRARMGQLDHRARMREIVEGGPSLTPVDHDYVVRRLRTVEGARDFAEYATTVPWLRWAEGRSRFKALFNGRTSKDTTPVLAQWFGRFVSDPDLHGAALQTACRLGQRFAPALVDSASWSAEHLSRADVQAGRRWKTLLASSIHGYSAPPELGFLLPYDSTRRIEHHAVIRAALQPYLALTSRWYAHDEDGTTPPDAELTWHTKQAPLSAQLERVVQETDAGDQILGALLEDALNNAYALLSGYHGDRGFDPLGFRRSAIEPHQQDAHRGPQDALIDALRDFGAKSLSGDGELPERWWRNGSSLFRRLALHLIALDQSRTPNQKLQWLLERNVLYSADEKHETFRVLAGSLQGSSAAVRAELLAASLVGPTYAEDVPDRDRHRAYSTYNLMAWISRSAPDWVEAAAAFASIQAANPTFLVRDHPDFDHWSSSGTWGGRLPKDPDDFAREAQTDLAATFDDLINRDYSERSIDEPTWDEALSVIGRVAETHPSLGDQIWRLIDGRNDLGDRAGTLKRSIIGGWERADLGNDALKITTLVQAEVQATESAFSISGFLLAQIQKLVESDETQVVSALRELARALWITQNSHFEHGPDSPPSSLALNSWPGNVASYWATEIDRRWRHNRDDWDGLNEGESSALLDLLGGPPSTQHATRPALARNVFFLFAADPAFVEAHILPLFSDAASAYEMWESFLYHPRVNDKMLGAGLLDAMVLEWGRLDSIAEHGLPNQFFDLVASVVTFAGLTSTDRQRLLDESVLAADGDHAANFASAVVNLLDTPDVNGAEVWNLWVRDHLSARLTGLPRTARTEELARWADTIPFLGEQIPDATDLLHGSGIGLGKAYHAPEFPDGTLEQFGTEIVAHLTERVRNTPSSGGHLSYEVAELISAVRATLDDAVQPLVEAAREQGLFHNVD
ncbi:MULTISPECIES: SIR2 family protein [unclassified Leifsonia]|uniref:SIR2 family protein n=1 Tax=unclassified Leifsonia TaxID=2663824 RepID=UPI0006FF9531|nr:MULTISPECIES: SIR2 family protein [unclassified Leifsonia]KQX06649.1 hypothetical protein ASC59_02000 [Leifsonia sp. Root1293]KRA10933.1 hypothetical protein ASD61_02000 [Leifsonia sp. Root60]